MAFIVPLAKASGNLKEKKFGRNKFLVFPCRQFKGVQKTRGSFVAFRRAFDVHGQLVKIISDKIKSVSSDASFGTFDRKFSSGITFQIQRGFAFYGSRAGDEKAFFDLFKLFFIVDLFIFCFAKFGIGHKIIVQIVV